MLVTTKIWISEVSLLEMKVEADLRFPDETGGVLMGYWSRAGEAVVTAVSGPGPLATHKPRSFVPDYEFQAAFVAEHYTMTSGEEAYLGDWHTHPKTRRPYLSGRDLRTLRSIATDPAARAPNPIAILLYGDEYAWNAKAWVGKLQRRLGPWFGLKVSNTFLHTYRT